MCSDPSMHFQQVVSCYGRTRFGFEASADRLELIVGRGGLDEGRSGSYLRVALFEPTVLLPHLLDVLNHGSAALARLELSQVPGQVVRWPPRPGQPPR